MQNTKKYMQEYGLILNLIEIMGAPAVILNVSGWFAFYIWFLIGFELKCGFLNIKFLLLSTFCSSESFSKDTLYRDWMRNPGLPKVCITVVWYRISTALWLIFFLTKSLCFARVWPVKEAGHLMKHLST